MTWGPYWMFYECKQCGKKYKYSVEDLQLPSFGKCPACKADGKLMGESNKNAPSDVEGYEEVQP